MPNLLAKNTAHAVNRSRYATKQASAGSGKE